MGLVALLGQLVHKLLQRLLIPLVQAARPETLEDTGRLLVDLFQRAFRHAQANGLLFQQLAVVDACLLKTAVKVNRPRSRQPMRSIALIQRLREGLEGFSRAHHPYPHIHHFKSPHLIRKSIAALMQIMKLSSHLVAEGHIQLIPLPLVAQVHRSKRLPR